MDEIRNELMDLLTPVKDMASNYDVLIAKMDALMRKLDEMQLLAAQQHNELKLLVEQRHSEIMLKLRQIADANDGRNDLLGAELKGLIQ